MWSVAPDSLGSEKKLGRYQHWALAQRLSTANHLSDVLLSSLVKSVVREGLFLVCSAGLSNERWFQGGVSEAWRSPNDR